MQNTIPSNKINIVLLNVLMFVFNAYTYSLHGYSGKLYHDKIQTDYYFNPNRKHKEKPKHSKANTVNITSGISDITSANHNDNIVQRDRSSTERKQEDEEQKTDNNNNSFVRSNHSYYHSDRHASRIMPVLHSGDIVTVKMKLNRNQGKFAVIYCINDGE
eukprot:341789_1